MKRSISYITLALVAFLPSLPKTLLAQTQVPQAETSAAGPAVATLGGTTFLAWKGKNATGSVWYSTLTGSAWSSQAKMSSETTSAPALAVANSTIYLAFKGQQEPSDAVYYTNWNGSAFPGSPTRRYPAPRQPLRRLWRETVPPCTWPGPHPPTQSCSQPSTAPGAPRRAPGSRQIRKWVRR